MQRSTTCARAVLAVSLFIVLGLVACGGGGESGGEIVGPDVPDTPSVPPPPPGPLVFSGLPDFAAASGVLGQPGFVTSASGAPSATRLSEPAGLAVSDSGSVFLADTVNRRVLVFREFPRNLGQAADFALGQRDLDSDDYFAPDAFDEPVSVAVANGMVAVADRLANRVVVYDAVPVDGNARPAFVVGQPDMNSNVDACDAATLSAPSAVQITPDGKLVVADTGHSRVLIWKSVPSADGVAADVVLGQPSFENCDRNAGGTAPSRGGMDEPEALWSDGTRLAVADTFNDRVLLWDVVLMSFPTGELPHRVLGQPGFDSAPVNAPPTADNLRRPRAVTSNGTHLAVGDNGNNRVLLWDGWPSQDHQPAKNVLGQKDMTRDLENDGALDPTAETLDGPMGVAIHQNKLLVVDRDNNRVLIYASP